MVMAWTARRSPWLRALAAVVVAATACSGSSVSAPAMSGASPAHATADIAAPTPPNSVPDGSEGAVRFEIDGDTLWRDVLAAVTLDELACIRDALGDELLESVMERPAVSEGDAAAFDSSGEWGLSMFGCLAEETARELLISFVVWVWSMEAGLDGEPIEVDEACLRDSLDDVGVAALLAADLSVSDGAVYWDMARCAPDVLVSVLLAVIDAAYGQHEGSGLVLDDDQRSCLVEVAADADWASLVEGSESDHYAAFEELRPGLSECGLDMTPAHPGADADDDHADTADGATPVSVGEAVQGAVDYELDMDFFVFEAEAGAPYRIEVSLGTLSDSVAVLYDAAGLELKYDDDGGEDLASRLLWKADSSGSYYVAVRGYEVLTGSYTLNLERTVDDHSDTASGSTPLAVGEAVQGAVDYGFDVDFFAFEAEAGESYRIDVALGTLSDSVAGLYDAGNLELDSNDDHHSEDLASRIDWQAESSGTFYVAVEGYAEQTGSYTLTVERIVKGASDGADPAVDG